MSDTVQNKVNKHRLWVVVYIIRRLLCCITVTQIIRKYAVYLRATADNNINKLQKLYSLPERYNNSNIQSFEQKPHTHSRLNAFAQNVESYCIV